MPPSIEARNDQLDGLRGYAAIAVVLFHSILGPDPAMVSRVFYQNYSKIGSWYDAWAKLALKVTNGETAVVIFFILSGAVLFDSLQKDRDGGLVPLAVKFFVRRFLRIYPAMLVCLFVCWATFNLVGLPRTVDQLSQNLTLYDFQINGATWSLNVEAFGAVFLFLAYAAYRRFREFGIVVVGCIFASVYLHAFDGYLIQFRMFIYSFALGALITTPLGRWVFERVPTRSWPLLLIAMIVARHTIQETIAAFLIGLIYYRKAGAFGEFLAKPVSVFFGRISYSLYLFNVLFLEIFNVQLQSSPIARSYPVEFGLLSGSVIIILTIPIAYLSMRYIEKPFIGLGRRLTRTSSMPRPASGTLVNIPLR